MGNSDLRRRHESTPSRPRRARELVTTPGHTSVCRRMASAPRHFVWCAAGFTVILGRAATVRRLEAADSAWRVACDGADHGEALSRTRPLAAPGGAGGIAPCARWRASASSASGASCTARVFSAPGAGKAATAVRVSGSAAADLPSLSRAVVPSRSSRRRDSYGRQTRRDRSSAASFCVESRAFACGHKKTTDNFLSVVCKPRDESQDRLNSSGAVLGAAADVGLDLHVLTSLLI